MPKEYMIIFWAEGEMCVVKRVFFCKSDAKEYIKGMDKKRDPTIVRTVYRKGGYGT